MPASYWPQKYWPGRSGPSAAPTLAIEDNGDGTVTATISAGETTAEHALLTQRIDPNFDLQGWTESETITGNGEITVDLANGVYFGAVQADGVVVGEPLFFTVWDSTVSVYEQILEAVAARIRLLEIVASNHVYVQKVNLIRGLTGPGVVVRPGKPMMPANVGVLGGDDVTYPVHAVCFEAEDPMQDKTSGQSKYLLWLQRIAKAFRQQRLAGVESVFLCTVEPLEAVDVADWKSGYWVSGHVLKFTSREGRGI